MGVGVGAPCLASPLKSCEAASIAILNDLQDWGATTRECWTGLMLEQLPTQVVPSLFVQVPVGPSIEVRLTN